MANPFEEIPVGDEQLPPAAPSTPPQLQVAVIIGVGVNSLKIPVLIVPSKKEAHDFLISKGCSRQGTIYYVPHEAEDNESHPFWKGILIRSKTYFGCGGCYAFTIKLVKPLTPFVGWDLD